MASLQLIRYIRLKYSPNITQRFPTFYAFGIPETEAFRSNIAVEPSPLAAVWTNWRKLAKVKHRTLVLRLPSCSASGAAQVEGFFPPCKVSPSVKLRRCWFSSCILDPSVLLRTHIFLFGAEVAVFWPPLSKTSDQAAAGERLFWT